MLSKIFNMKLILFILLFIGSPNQVLVSATQKIKVLDSSFEILNSDMLEVVAGFVDDETAFTLSHASATLRNQTQSRINQYKFQALKRNCPTEFNYLTKNGNALLMSSFKPAVRIYESLDFGDSKEDIISMLHQRRLCIQSMHIAKDLIKDRLDQITIALPPIRVSNQQEPNYHVGYDAVIGKSIDKYFASIKLLVDTRLVKKILIKCAGRFTTLDLRVEEKLYQFLLLIKVPALSFHISVHNQAAFNEFAVGAKFVKNIYLRRQANVILRIPTSVETFENDERTPDMSQSNMPNLKSITVNGEGQQPDLTKYRSKLESITFTHTHSLNSFMESVCSKNNHQLTELSLGHVEDDVSAARLRSCLMGLKPHLRKFSFVSTSRTRHFWNDFAIDFLQDNSVLKKFSVKFDSYFNNLQTVDFTFLNITYNQLNLTHFSMSSNLQSNLMMTTAIFISKQTSLIHLDIKSEYPISNHLNHLQPVFQSIADNDSVKKLNIVYDIKLIASDIAEYLKKFVVFCSLLEGRSMELNGIPVENVVRDLKVGHNVTLWKRIAGTGVAFDSVLLSITTLTDFL